MFTMSSNKVKQTAEVFFAYHYPYSFTDLQRTLARLETNPRLKPFVRRLELCRTLGMLPCDLLEIAEDGRKL